MPCQHIASLYLMCFYIVQYVNVCSFCLHLLQRVAYVFCNNLVISHFFCYWRWYWFCSMADDFSQSLTPPVSPFAADSLCELIAARPPCFCCSETKDDPTGALSTEGYTARGSLTRYSHWQFTIWTKTHFATWRTTVFTLRPREMVPLKTIDSWHKLQFFNDWIPTHLYFSILMGWVQKSQWQNNLKVLTDCIYIHSVGCCCVSTRPLQNMRQTLWRSLASPG